VVSNHGVRANAKAAGVGFTLLLALAACSAPKPHAHTAATAVTKPSTLSPYLRAATSGEVVNCESASRSVGLDALCPLVLPGGQYTTPWCQNDKQDPCAYMSSVYGASLLAQAVFKAPPDYVGMQAGVGHFVVWATTQGNRAVVPCLVGSKVDSMTNAGRNWDIWHCGQQSPDDPGSQVRGGREIVDGGEVMQDHIVFVTTVDNTNTEVSLHGVTTVNLQLLVQITAHMQPSEGQAGQSGTR